MVSAIGVIERCAAGSACFAASRGGPIDLHYGSPSYPHDGRSPDFLLKIADLRLYQCRSQSSFSAPTQRLHPRFAPDDMSLRMDWEGSSRTVTAPVMDISYGGIAFRVRKKERWPKRWKAEILQKNDPERHAIRLRAMNMAPLPGGGLRVGCAYA
jgi:hypothetical protein